MNEFRTVIKLKDSYEKVSYDSVLLFAGSCFSENIGNKFIERQFSAAVNPFGILYNPVSVKQGLEILLEKRLFQKDDLFRHEGRWHSFYHHSRFSSPEKTEALKTINENIDKGHDVLKKADFLFITFGTAWVYENVEDGTIVANCHKLPASRFRRYRLGVGEIVKSYSGLVDRLREFNPGLKIIFTVSPVRHWKDGAHGNQLSKSVLLLAVDELVRKFYHVDYFEAYELVVDDLRDYRFYAEDMLHPGSVAVDYIWDRLSDMYFDDDAKSFVKEIEKIIKAKEHRPFNEKGEEYRAFLSNMAKKLDVLSERFPAADLKKDKEYFKHKLDMIVTNL